MWQQLPLLKLLLLFYKWLRSGNSCLFQNYYYYFTSGWDVATAASSEIIIIILQVVEMWQQLPLPKLLLYKWLRCGNSCLFRNYYYTSGWDVATAASSEIIIIQVVEMWQQLPLPKLLLLLYKWLRCGNSCLFRNYYYTSGWDVATVASSEIIIIIQVVEMWQLYNMCGCQRQIGEC